jgi:exodeoxyribonuclease VII large subunit
MNQWLRRIFTISELTLLIRNQLEQGFSGIWVEGEVSNLRAPASGHVYFTLKDQTSQIRAVLFRAGAQRLRFSLREGLHVIVQGRLTVYEPRGEYQAVVDYLEPKGIGALQIALGQLKEKLAREGLFDLARKRHYPARRSATCCRFATEMPISEHPYCTGACAGNGRCAANRLRRSRTWFFG